MNLLKEYCHRHDMNFLWAVNEGLVFFNNYDRPALIVTINTLSRQSIVCSKCQYNGINLVAEIFSPSLEAGYSLTHHLHIEPETDLLKLIKSIGYDYEPYWAKNKQDLEVWLWRFFICHQKLRHATSWKSFVERQIKTNTNEYYLEQMLQCILAHPGNYNTYYGLFQSFMVGRTYLLYDSENTN